MLHLPLCERCTRPYNLGAFASLYHPLCLECEREVLKPCKVCGAEKPLIAFALCHDVAGGRENKCKACKCAGLTIPKICLGCNQPIPGAGANSRYCSEPCRKLFRDSIPKANPGEVRVTRAHAVMLRILSMPWGKKK